MVYNNYIQIAQDASTSAQENTDKAGDFVPQSRTFERSTACCKNIYPSLRIAKEVQHYRQRSPHKAAGFLRVYHCPRCNGWHITSQRSQQDESPHRLSTKQHNRWSKQHSKKIRAMRRAVKF